MNNRQLFLSVPSFRSLLFVALITRMAFIATASIADSRIVDLGYKAFEHAEVSIRTTSDHSGYLYARCIACALNEDDVELLIDGDSVFLYNHQPISLLEAASIDGDINGVIFDPKENTLIKYLITVID